MSESDCPIYPNPTPVYLDDVAAGHIAAQRRQPAPAPAIPSRPSPAVTVAFKSQRERIALRLRLLSNYLGAMLVVREGGPEGEAAWADCEQAVRLMAKAAARRRKAAK
jgi:hypothetical protein